MSSQGLPLRAEQHEEEDGVLMQRVAAGDTRAFQTLMRRHLAKTVRLAARMLGSEEAADDAAQEAFVRVWKNAQRFQSPDEAGARFTTWLYKIVLNIVIDEKRKRKNVSIDDISEPVDDSQNIEGVLQQREKRSIFRKAMSALPYNQQRALMLCFFEDFSNKQAAEVMGVTVKAVESLLVRARKNLRTEVEIAEKEMTLHRKDNK